jgi:hypothetical protein
MTCMMIRIKGMSPRASSGLNLNFDLLRRKQRGIKNYNKYTLQIQIVMIEVFMVITHHFYLSITFAMHQIENLHIYH